MCLTCIRDTDKTCKAEGKQRHILDTQFFNSVWSLKDEKKY